MKKDRFRFWRPDIVPKARDAVIADMSDGVLVLDAQNRIVEINPAAQQITGLGVSAIGQPAAGVLSALPVLARPSEAAAQTQTEISLGEGAARRDYELRVSPLTDRRGRLAGRLVVLRDITEHKQSEKVLQESQERFRVLFERSPDAILLLDPMSRSIVDCNEVACRMNGYSRQELVGQPVDILEAIRLSEKATYLEHIQRVGSFKYETYRRRKNGTVFPVEVSTSLITLDGRALLLCIDRDITERKQAEAELFAQKRLFEDLVAVARATVERPTLEATLQNALDVAVTLTGAERGDLLLVNEAGVVTYSTLTGGRVTDQRQDDLNLVMDKGLAGWVARRRQGTFITDTSKDDRWLSLPGRDYSVRSAMSVPILSGATILGVLTLTHPRPGHFTAEHLHLMQAAADQMALAVRNAQIFDTQRRTAEREISLYRVLRAVSGQLEPEAVARTAVDAIAQFTGWPHVVIALPSEDRTHLVARAASGALSTAVGLKIPIDQGVVGQAFVSAQTQLMSDVSAKPDYMAEHPAVHSKLAVPLRRGERVLGVLDLASDRTAAFGPDDVLLAESLADAVALALDNARLYAEMRRHVNNSNALYAIARMTSQTLALEEVLPQALSSAMVLLEFEAGLLGLTDPESEEGGRRPPRLRMTVHRRLPPDQLEYIRSSGLESTLCGYVYEQGESLVIGDFEQEAPAAVSHLVPATAAFGWRSFAGIPLLHQKRLLGALCLFSRRTRSPSAYDVALLTTIGHQVATAVENARLFQDTLFERSRLQALIKSSRDGVVMVGMEGHILVINAGAMQLLRMPGVPEEWLGRRILDVLRVLHVYAPAAARAMLTEVRRIRKGDESPGEGEAEVPPRVFHWLSLPVMAGTMPLGWLVVLRDVTDERAVERLREDMTHTMVHDLRNPLTSIFSALEFLEMEADMLSADHRHVLEIAFNGTQKMLGLVNSILDVSRLESGRVTLNRQTVYLGDLVAEVLRSQEPLAAGKELRLESDVPATLPPAWADAELIGRVLQNLIGNAIKFTPTGGVIRVTAKAEEGEKPLVLVAVCDTGPGIPPQIEGRLFQRFVTGRQTGSGSGLGLAFCKVAVEAHDGRIWVESTPGQGATFTFSLPIASSSVQESQ